MGEIFRLQVGLILGGRRRWLVLLALLMPVLLSLAAVTQGDFDELQVRFAKDRAEKELALGELPKDFEPVERHGERLEFGSGSVVWDDQGIQVAGEYLDGDLVFVDESRALVIRKDGIWAQPGFLESNQGLSLNGVWVPDADSDSDGGEFDAVADPARLIYAVYLFLLYPQVLCLLLALLYGTSALGNELDGKTLPYLFTRPLPRWRFVLGKYLGIVASLIVPTAVSLTLSWALITGMQDLGLLLASLAGALGALLAYNGLFILLGFIAPRRAMILALLYGLLFEFVLSFIPALINQITVTYYLRSLVADILSLELPKDLARIVGGATLPTALLALAAITTLTLAASTLLASHREYVVKDEA